MWCAMGQCYESDQLQMTVAAIRCYQRAVTWNDMEGIALAKLAKLHRDGGNQKAAAHYYRLNLVRLEKEGEDTTETMEALLFLANFYKKYERYRDAEACCACGCWTSRGRRSRTRRRSCERYTASRMEGGGQEPEARRRTETGRRGWSETRIAATGAGRSF